LVLLKLDKKKTWQYEHAMTRHLSSGWGQNTPHLEVIQTPVKEPVYLVTEGEILRKKYYILIFGLCDFIHIRLWTNGCFFANKRWRSLTGSEVILYSTQSSLYRNQLLQVTKRSTGPKLIACLQHTHVTSLIRDLISSRLYKMPRALK
jgi:hypothetical protein